MSKPLVGDPLGTWRSFGRISLILAMAISCIACGTVPPPVSGSSGIAASSARSPSPSIVALPDPAVLTSKGCSGTAPTTPVQSLAPYYSIRPAAGWTDTGDYVHTESLLLELTAPASYGFAPTRIRLYAFPFDVLTDFGPTATAHSLATDETTSHRRITSPQLQTTAVSDCTVALEAAGTFGYADGGELGYWLLVIHQDRLFGIKLQGAGGIADPGIRDTLSMLGTIAWIR